MTHPNEARHCETCYCGRRAPVQESRQEGKSAGTITWAEHLEAHALYGPGQSALRIAARGGFSYGELMKYYLLHEPTTWSPEGYVAARADAERRDRAMSDDEPRGQRMNDLETIEITLAGLRSTLRGLSDTLDEDEGPVIIAWSADRLAEKLFVSLRPKLMAGEAPDIRPNEAGGL